MGLGNIRAQGIRAVKMKDNDPKNIPGEGDLKMALYASHCREFITRLSPVLCLALSLFALSACSDDPAAPEPVPSDGAPALFISYFNETRNDLFCAARIDESWAFAFVSYSNGRAGQTAIAVDADGIPHICYYEIGVDPVRFDAGPCRGISGMHAQGYLMYASRSSGSWTVEEIEKIFDYEGDNCVVEPKLDISIALDADGVPHAGYYQCETVYIPPSGYPLVARILSDGYLKYASRKASGWEPELVDHTYSLDGIGVYCASFLDFCLCDCLEPNPVELLESGLSLSMDRLGYPHICYSDPLKGQLTYAVKSGAEWEYDPVDPAGGSARHPSLAIDAGNIPHVVYYDSSERNLWYATRAGGAWNREIVDGADNNGHWASLAVDPGGVPHVSYCDAESGQLKYAVKREGFWFIETIDFVGGEGRGISMVMDGDGTTHIGYCDVSAGALKYASNKGGRWTIEIVDCWGQAGAYPSIALGRK